jgi:RNA polymerase sigma factor (sigma-70 family)
MSTAVLDTLLERLCAGDEAAAEQVFREYEPYLRTVVRRMLPRRLRAKFDSADVVQSVWADLLQRFREAGGRFTDRDHLSAFLITATRHRFIDRYRQHRRAAAREQPFPPEDAAPEYASPLPRPSELAQADELWEQLLAHCPPEHRELLRLKRDGLPLAEIALRTGLHEDSVRRVVRRLARKVALRQRPATDANGTAP